MSDTTDTTKARMDAFLAELTELTRKHRMVIGGCGCCKSPWVVEVDLRKSWNPAGSYKVDSDGDELDWVMDDPPAP